MISLNKVFARRRRRNATNDMRTMEIVFAVGGAAVVVLMSMTMFG